MSIINYKNRIQPQVWLSFQTFKVSGAHSTANESFLYQVENEALFEFTITAKTDSKTFLIPRQATGSDRLFSTEKNTYISNPVPGPVLNEILEAHDAKKLSLTITVKLKYQKFFLELIKNLTRSDSDTFNIARPFDGPGVLASFDYQRSGNKGIITHKVETKEIKAIPAMLSSYKVFPASKAGAAPTVQLFVYMRIREAIPYPRYIQISQMFIAADYTKVYKFAKTKRSSPWFGDPKRWSRVWPDTNPSAPKPTGIERCLKTWEKNVINYLWVNTSLTRGKNIRDEIHQTGKSNSTDSQLDLVKKIRNSIDVRLITANHWGDLREDWHTEQYQCKLSDLFGEIHQNKWFASPVCMQRELKILFPDTVPGLHSRMDHILQWGLGHCGEHGIVSFLIIHDLMNDGLSAKFENVILSGNANIDHVFVVGGIRVYKAYRTFYRKFPPPEKKIGDPINVWNLRETLAANPGKDGFVLDAYLAPSRQAQTGTTLLTSLNRPSRGGKITDFLKYSLQYPISPPVTAEDRASVKNV